MTNDMKIILLAIMLLFGAMGFRAYEIATAQTTPQIVDNGGFTKTQVFLPALTELNNGFLVPLYVEIKPGAGKILVKIDNPSFIVDTQQSVRKAVEQAASLTNTDQIGRASC